jgi:hypothetical protein
VAASNFDLNRPDFFIVGCKISCFYAGMSVLKPVAVTAGSSQPPALSARERAAARALARMRYEQQAKMARLITVLSLFLVLLAAALTIGGRTFIDPLLQAAAAKREANRVGDVVLAMPDGAFCRHLSFDNRTSEFAGNTVERCEQTHGKGEKRAVNGFSWGSR